MKSADPHKTDPTGAPSPFERQNVSESKGSAQVCHRSATCDGRVEDAGTIEVHRQAVVSRGCCGFLQLIQWKHPAPALIVRVLDREHASGRVVDVDRVDRGGDFRA